MKLLVDYLRELTQATMEGWNRFWFSPTRVETLCAIRVLAGLMLVYTHLVWTIDLDGFFGAQGSLSVEFSNRFQRLTEQGSFAWSHLYWLSDAQMVVVHYIALLVLLLFTIGLWTRVTSILSFLITVSYAHRAAGALFGLDQINGLLSMYLMIGPSGACYSVDRWLASRSKSNVEVSESVSANLAIRLMQIHLCIIYFFAAIGKMLGASWWDGNALWLAFGNYEYQTLDMTWLAAYPLLIHGLSQFTVLWELTYSFFVWPRLTRPIILSLAVPLHLGIAICMGMITFGLVMLFANMAFVSPYLVRAVVDRIRGRAGESKSMPLADS